MTDWSEKIIQETKDYFREHYGAELSTEDAIESLENLTNLFELLLEWDCKTQKEGRDLLT